MSTHDKLNIPLSELINCLSDTIDLVSSDLNEHHNRVGYIAYSLACQMGLTETETIDLHFAGNLHDIGALSLTDRLRLLTFEEDNPHEHSETGALLLEMFKPLAQLGELVRFHHVPWNYGAGELHRGRPVPSGSHLLHLADRISVLIGRSEGASLLTRAPEILTKIRKASNTIFTPEHVDAFSDMSCRESFWLGLAFPGHNHLQDRQQRLKSFKLDTDGVIGLSRLFARIIDFRSRFTATHSSGVSASAEVLARLSGRPATECSQMKIAGLLHDLGKLAVPAELLEKPTGLSDEERALMCCHTYFTRRALENIRSFESITDWSANHHERIDGKGYPNHTVGKGLSLGSRIMSVADVFTAVTEDRPYRAGMDRQATRKVLNCMVAQSALDPEVVGILLRNFDELNMARNAAQQQAVTEYTKLNFALASMSVGRA